MKPLDDHIKNQLDTYIVKIGEQLSKVDPEQLGEVDTMLINSALIENVDEKIRDAIEIKKDRKKRIAIILHTLGGIVEVVERMVGIIRNFYKEVIVIVPNQAMSAGTVFALSADRIMMDYFSRLGPIDPQIYKDGKLVPALSYLKQYEKLNEKAKENKLTTVEYTMLQKLNLGELYQFEQARDLSVELLIKWLSQYKFKNWKKTESRGQEVTDELKEQRAKEIANILNDPDKWHSHGRGIGMITLTDEVNLKIEDYSEETVLKNNIREYYSLMSDYYIREKLFCFIHSKDYFDTWRDFYYG